MEQVKIVVGKTADTSIYPITSVTMYEVTPSEDKKIVSLILLQSELQSLLGAAGRASISDGRLDSTFTVRDLANWCHLGFSYHDGQLHVRGQVMRYQKKMEIEGGDSDKEYHLYSAVAIERREVYNTGYSSGSHYTDVPVEIIFDEE